MKQEREQMSIVIVGHVDHGKSTVIGRLLADTGSLPKGKLEQVRQHCARNAKPFEYAFLLDALKDEQAQGITIDTARCFFKTVKRNYIIIDAPGHIEFLKNMITGAARAEAALLVIDAKEGIQENSRRHGFMLSLLGIDQVVVLVNKMDLVGYEQRVFEEVVREYRDFLSQIKVDPIAFVPISAREGHNLASCSKEMQWYEGPCVLELIDSLKKEKNLMEQPFRLPVQDIYKFTEANDDRRIVAGTVETGKVKVGDEVIFLPSSKRAVIQSIEGFNEPVKHEVGAGYATGVTLAPQIYIKPGEIMCRAEEPLPVVGNTFRAHLFWLGRHPMVAGKKYKLKLATERATVYLKQIERVLDAAELSVDTQKDRIERHDVADCILQTVKPIAYDLSRDIAATGRFVIIDHYEIAGGGIITGSIAETDYIKTHVSEREVAWEKSNISPEQRASRFGQRPKFIVITGTFDGLQANVAKGLEEKLFRNGHNVYYLAIANLLHGLFEAGLGRGEEEREEDIRRLGELARIFTDAGLIFITDIPRLDSYEIDILKALNQPNEILVIDLDEYVSSRDTAGESLEILLKKIETVLYQQDIVWDYSI